MIKVEADIDEKGRIRCTFPFDARLVRMIKDVPGARFQPPDKGGPAWLFTLELMTARLLKKKFGEDLKIKPALAAWGRKQKSQHELLNKLIMAEQAPLERLPEVLPDLWRAVHVGPKGRGWTQDALQAAIDADPGGSYQTADVSYMAHAPNPLNGNQPGTGKTIETIASVFEAGMDEGPHLVLAPLSSLETVWFNELAEWQCHPVWLCEGSTSMKTAAIADFMNTDGPGWLVCNHHMAQMVKPRSGPNSIVDEEAEAVPRFPQLYDIEWNTVILDEIHKAGFRDTNSMMFRGMSKLQALKKIGLSGTPIGGRAENLWILLHWLNPDDFTSKWRWAEQWLNIENNGYGQVIGGIRDDLEEAFYEYHAKYFCRRLKKDVLKDLPPKQYVDLWVEMEAKQKKQYEEFALQAEVRIDDEMLSATGILAEYTRLKQFAISYNELEGYVVDGERKVRPIPTEFSCKLDALEQLLEERGIFDDDGEEQVVIFSQFSKVVDMVYAWLEKKKVRVSKLTGATNKQGQRAEITKSFQSGESRVICMTTTAGGVAITLDAADTVVFMDETWVPDDQEQGEDRVHRASRIHQVTIYYIRTRGTIEEYIRQVLVGKENVNRIILDLRKAGLRASEKASES